MITAFNNEEFIEEVKKYPAIWDPTCAEFRSRKTKEAAWMSVSSACLANFDSCSESEKEGLCKKLANKWRAIRDNYVRYLKQMKLNQNKTYKYAKRLSTFLVIKNNDADDDDDGSDDEQPSRRRTSSYDDDYSDTKRRKHNASPLFVGKEEPLSSDDYELEIATPQPHTPEAIFPQISDSSDEDRCFFDSLMPACKTLDMDQKLHFRSQVINLLRHIRKGNDRVRLDPVNGVFINED